jgi:TPR repeat protein
MTATQQSDLAFAALEREDYALARQLLESLVASGNQEGEIHLGWLCELGLGGPSDLAQAQRLYEAVLTRDSALGSYHLGVLLMKHGDRRKALELLEHAARMANPSAAYWAHVMYLESGDVESSRRMLDSAAQLGHAFAQRDIAREQMRSARSIASWLSAALRHWRSKARIASLGIRDFNDPRVR